jgi:ATP-dependent exoDNAse (exonuclease V) beta subunit
MFTSQQRAAITDRSRSLLLSASAGSGKTAVMVERFVEAVLNDGVKPDEILALTFTEKAAGELRERIGHRLIDLGAHELELDLGRAWIGTIHSFCLRVLRSHPLALDLDPRFTVCDESTARRTADSSYQSAFEEWIENGGGAAIDAAAAYGAGLRSTIFEAYGELRSRGITEDRLPLPARPTVPDRQRVSLLMACADMVKALGEASGGKRISEAVVAVQACQELAEREGQIPLPDEFLPTKLGKGAKLLQGEIADRYRECWDSYRQACIDYHAYPVLLQFSALLKAFGESYRVAKHRRASVDFEDLQLLVRDLFRTDRAILGRWRERFSLIMIDEFQDTNRLQLEILSALERDNLFTVGDEFQSIYAFRHADVRIFRERRAELGVEQTLQLSTNFRSVREVLGVVNDTFQPTFGTDFSPLVAATDADPSPQDDLEPRVELLLTKADGWEEREGQLGLSELTPQIGRRAEARLLAHRVRQEVDGGRKLNEIVVLVRATSSLRLLEQALEDQGLATYVIGGRGYWSKEQVRDCLAYLNAFANPLNEDALYGVLASPFCGVNSDALMEIAFRVKEIKEPAWEVLQDRRYDRALLTADDNERLERFTTFFRREREAARGLPIDLLLERAMIHTGYDLEILVRPDGERRFANVRKLMRLAREYEASEGRDLHGFLAYAQTQDHLEAHEGEAPIESEGLEAIRLMTIHRAKGLEFPVACVADLGRAPNGGHPDLLIDSAGGCGLRLRLLGQKEVVSAYRHCQIDSQRAADMAEEERRLFYVAMTRAREHLLLSATRELDGFEEYKPHNPPIDWIVPEMFGGSLSKINFELADQVITSHGQGAGQIRLVVNGPETIDQLLPGSAFAPHLSSNLTVLNTVLPDPPAVESSTGGKQVVARSKPSRLSYSSLQRYVRCPYRFYLQRELRLEDVDAANVHPLAAEAASAQAEADSAAQTEFWEGDQGRLWPETESSTEDLVTENFLPDKTTESEPELTETNADSPELSEGPTLTPMQRGSAVHLLLDRLDFKSQAAPDTDQIQGLCEIHFGKRLSQDEVGDIQRLIENFLQSQLFAKIANTARIQREVSFAFALSSDLDEPTQLQSEEQAPIVSGVVDLLAQQPGGNAVIIDYKTDPIGEVSPDELVDRSYSLQRSIYALAALSQGSAEVEVAHCFLEDPKAISSSHFTQADRPRLIDELKTAAGGLLSRQYPVAEEPHFDLCRSCPGRETLCSWSEQMTLRTLESA